MTYLDLIFAAVAFLLLGGAIGAAATELAVRSLSIRGEADARLAANRLYIQTHTTRTKDLP